MVDVNQNEQQSEQNTVTVDIVLEAFYRAFKTQVSPSGDNVGEVLKDIPERYRDRVFQRWQEESAAPVIGILPVIRKAKPVWREAYSSATGPRWFALKSFLELEKELPPERIAALDASSDAVLFSLGDPMVAAPEDGSRKYAGLVVGYVQSGKTANYTAVAAKAIDAGFRLVVVLSGVHNSLRRQTQMRMNDELGLIPSQPGRPTAADYAPQGISPLSTLTSELLTNGDFAYMNVKPVIALGVGAICVTKKNVAVLKKLRKWLGENVSVPVLIIDDEADQASINAHAGAAEDFDPDRDPTAINEQIRSLIKSCSNYAAYVGYTATPYANVFIDMNAFHTRLTNDLYPKDFIISLPKPPGYMGPEEFFGPNLTGEDENFSSVSERVLEIVPEEEIDLVKKFVKDQSGKVEFPKMLKEAVKDFILGTAARRRFEGKISPSSFLAHTTHLQGQQALLGMALEKLVVGLHQDWRYNKDAVLGKWKDDWDELKKGMLGTDYAYDFEELIPQLDILLGQFGSISVRTLNFKSPDELDYEAEPNLCAIVVGGNKLSRGLTLEGLIVSYFVRQSSQPKADTLTQMGRFFGYRGHLVDITKVYTSHKLMLDFQDISYMESSLRQDIERYARSGKTPEDFAPRVMRRAGLLPTGHMGAGREQGFSYSGDLVQTISFQEGEDVNRENLNLATTFIKLVDGSSERESLPSGQAVPTKLLWRDVSTPDILSFLSKFKTVPKATRVNATNIVRYIEDSLNDPEGSELTTWNVGVIGRNKNEALGVESFGLDIKIGRISRSLDKANTTSIGTLITPLTEDFNRGDELLDFTDDMRKEALEYKAKGLTSGDAARSARDAQQGLLLVYPLSPFELKPMGGLPEKKTLGEALGFEDTIVGLAVVFPHSNLDHTSRQFWQQ
jgi:hypothetical protein